MSSHFESIMVNFSLCLINLLKQGIYGSIGIMLSPGPYALCRNLQTALTPVGCTRSVLNAWNVHISVSMSQSQSLTETQYIPYNSKFSPFHPSHKDNGCNVYVRQRLTLSLIQNKCSLVPKEVLDHHRHLP